MLPLDTSRHFKGELDVQPPHPLEEKKKKKKASPTLRKMLLLRGFSFTAL